MIIYPASIERPEDYPHGLPFVPGTLVEISEFADAAVMKWFGVERPFDLMQVLTGASVGEGWMVVDDDSAGQPAPAPPRRRRFRAGSYDRDVEVLQAGPFTSVVLRQRRREE
jgi:hypothetical protein